MTNKINKYLLIALSITIFNCGGKEEKVAKNKVAIDSKVLSKTDIMEKNIANIPKAITKTPPEPLDDQLVASEKNTKRNTLKNPAEKQSPRLKKRNTMERKQPLVNKVKAPNFYLSDLDGNIYDLSAFSGQVIMLNFWGTWCGPCRKEIPDFIKLYDKYNSDGLEIVGVTLQSGSAENIRRFTTANGINYPILTDVENYEAQKAFIEYGKVTGVGSRGVPTTYIIDREGYIVKSYIGPRPGAVFYKDFKPYL